MNASDKGSIEVKNAALVACLLAASAGIAALVLSYLF